MIPSFVFIFEQLKYSQKMILLVMELIFIIYYFNAQSSLPLLSNISDPQLNIDKLVTTFGDDVNFCSSELAHGEYLPNKEYDYRFRFLYKGIIIKHNKTEPTYTKTSLFLCEKRRFFMARTEKGVVTTI